MYSMLIDLYGIDPDDDTAFVPIDQTNDLRHELSWALGAAVFSALGLSYERPK